MCNFFIKNLVYIVNCKIWTTDNVRSQNISFVYRVCQGVDFSCIPKTKKIQQFSVDASASTEQNQNVLGRTKPIFMQIYIMAS